MPHHSRTKVGTKVVCVVLLIGALLLLEEENPVTTTSGIDDNTDVIQKYSAVFMALRKHPPSLRIFRSLLEWNLLLWGTVISLKLWYRYVGNDMVAELLFNTGSSDHNDYGDFGGTANDAKGRSSTYSGLRFEDADQSFQSEVLFDDYDASFSSIATGTKQNKDDVAYIQQQQQPTPEKALGDPILSNTQPKLQEPYTDDSDDNDAEEEEEGEEEESSDAQNSGFDAQPVTPRAPSVDDTTNAALDMLLPILVALFFFTLLSTHKLAYRLSQKIGWLAPLIPLLLVFYLTIAQLLRPWKPRKHFFIVISWTMAAPLYPVTFRDGFIGDIFTSTVRPLQDVAFTICYILSGFQGYWTDGYEGFWDSVNHNPHGLNDDDDAVALLQQQQQETEAPHSLVSLPPLETSWWLHTVLLPMCMVSPLWWRFLQNLRQTHDNRRRWPYLGNAFKYLLAAEVAMFGVFDPSKQKTYVWLGWFVVATLYQIWWDVWMDWELLVPNTNTKSWCGFRLRDKRLYPSKAFYWSILVVNILLRFCWTLSFLPPRYLNQAGVLSDTFQHSDWSRALAPAIASAEIIRRTMWGWIRLENEAIKVAEEQENPMLLPEQILELQYRGNNPEEAFGDALDGMEPMSLSTGLSGGRNTTMMAMSIGDDENDRWSFSRRQGLIPALWENWKTMEHTNEIQVLGELALWATVFATLGMIAAAHRMTL